MDDDNFLVNLDLGGELLWRLLVSSGVEPVFGRRRQGVVLVHGTAGSRGHRRSSWEVQVGSWLQVWVARVLGGAERG